MCSLKFDFSDVTLMKMPNEKKAAFKKFKKPKFQLQAPEVVTLSDSEDSKDLVEIIEEPVDVISITESSSSEDECENKSIEIVTLDDSDSLCNNQRKEKEPAVSKALDYIPIPDYISNKFKNKPKKRKNKLSSKGDTQDVKRKKLEMYNGTPILKLSHSNVFDGKTTELSGLRPIVIDGCNVACQYGNGKFSIRGVILVIQYFLNRGHTEITCFLPAHFRHKNDRTPDESKIIHTYEKDGIITYTPSRKLITGKSITPYDDRFIVQYASISGGVIISNDGYRDLWQEEASWKTTIENRVINYTFVKDVFMLPKDPLGRNGPSLDEILKFS